MSTPTFVRRSIPWMPERAWTIARMRCAILGITRMGFASRQVQLDLPCTPTCLPAPQITWVWQASFSALETQKICLSDLNNGSSGELSRVTMFQIWDVRDGQTPRLLAGNTTMETCCFRPADWGYAAGDEIHCYMQYFWDQFFECGGISYALPIISIGSPT